MKYLLAKSTMKELRSYFPLNEAACNVENISRSIPNLQLRLTNDYEGSDESAVL